MNNRMLTGIKPTGKIHIGNYVGSIKTMLEYSKKYELFLMIADGHALTFPRPAADQLSDTLHLVAALLSFDFNIDDLIIYRQSAIKDIFRLSWILSCFCNKGLLNRGHAMKAQKDQEDGELGVGLYTYPVLMAADIIGMDADIVPVGQDQKQHLEICRDLALKVNHFCLSKGIDTGDDLCCKVPEMLLAKQPSILGVDGRKMSKSYDNTIALFTDSQVLKSSIYKIKTDSLAADEPKETETLFDLYCAFSSDQEAEALRLKYQTGIGWKAIKDIVFEKIDSFMQDKREKYNYWHNNPEKLKEVLERGDVKAKAVCEQVTERIMQKLGLLV